MTTFYQGTMVRGEAVHDKWVWIEWLYPGQNKVRAIKDVKAIEDRIRAEHLRGWLAGSERGHKIMHKILAKMGAKKYQEDDHALYFQKEVG